MGVAVESSSTVLALEQVNEDLLDGRGRVVGYKGGQKLIGLCPLHNEKRPSFAVFSEGGYCCQGCGATGHVTELYQQLAAGRWAPLSSVRGKAAEPVGLSLGGAELDRAHKILLGQLRLHGPERQALTERGLGAAEVEQLWEWGYRSTPRWWGERTRMAGAVVAELGEKMARALPCLGPSKYGKHGLALPGMEGLLIPVRDVKGRLVAFKVRRSREGDGPRYLWWKANESQNGTGAPLHVSRGRGERGELALVVEGPLKADLVSLLWPRIYGESVTVVAIPGASAHGQLLETLEALGVKRVCLALDQDLAGQKASVTLEGILGRSGLALERARWPEEYGKIDDFLLRPDAPHHELRRAGQESPPEGPKGVVRGETFPNLVEARKEAREWLKKALKEPRGVFALGLEMGGGKTRMAVDLINELQASGELAGQVGFFTARYEQAEQFQETAEWARHYGLNHGCAPGGVPTDRTPCRNLSLSLPVVGLGAPVKLACQVCDLKAECAKNWGRDPQQPFYLAQKTTSKSIHLYNANALRDPSVVSRLDTLILDDLDLEAQLVDCTELSWEQILGAIRWAEENPGYAPAGPMLRALFAAQTSLPARSGPYDQPRLNGEPLQDVLAQALGGLEGLREILDYALTAEDAHPLDALGRIRGQIPHRAILKALRRLSQELAWRGQSDWNPMLHLGQEGLRIWTRAELNLAHKRMVVLNAGQGAEQLRRIFPDLAVSSFKASVNMPDRTKVRQLYQGPRSRVRKAELTEEVFQVFEERQRIHPKEVAESWGFVGFRETAQRLEEKFPGLQARYYGNQTGSNALGEVKFLVVAGNHQPHPQTFLEQAQAIYGNSARLNETNCLRSEFLQDRAGHQVRVRRRGFVDPRLDERWHELSVGEVRQAFGRARPWNTGSFEREQGQLWTDEETRPRQLEVVVISSYALPGVVADELEGCEVDLEERLVAAALRLRQAGKLVTREALRELTGVSERQIRRLLPRVRLRSEGVHLTRLAAACAASGVAMVLEVEFWQEVPRSRDWGVGDLQRGPPAGRECLEVGA